MKAFLAPAIAVVLSTAFSNWMCRLWSMPPRDVYIATIVAFGTSATVAFTVTALMAGSRKSPTSLGTGE